MPAFTDERLALMQEAAVRNLPSFHLFRNASFVAMLEGTDEAVRIEVGGGSAAVTAGSGDAPPDGHIGLRGTTESWEGYFTGSGPVSRNSLSAMVIAEAVSGGVLASELEPIGDLVRLVANLPILDRIVEPAVQAEG